MGGGGENLLQSNACIITTKKCFDEKNISVCTLTTLYKEYILKFVFKNLSLKVFHNIYEIL